MNLASTTDIREALQAHFGFDDFLPGQREVLGHLLAGHSSAAVFPTGGGKSICYQLPSLLLPGVTLVISPLIALMKDQVDSLRARGIAAQKLDSTLTGEQYRDVMREFRDGSLKMLYVAPERLQNERFREAIRRTRISLLAVDEAHCISEWGHNFRPDYLKLAEFAREAQVERILALTATATPQVLEDVCRGFGIDRACAVRTGFYRPNLTVLTTPVELDRRDAVLLERLRQRPAGPTMVYVTLQRTAEEVAARLGQFGLPARAYHAGMDDAVRAEVQDWFLSSTTGIVVATIAFGMGVDKPDIRYVYHYNLPKSLENFAQEIGRAGRDGAASTCEMLVCLDDLNVLENFALGDTPTTSSVRGLLDELFSLGQKFDVSYYELSARHDIRVLVVRTLITYLELDGYLQGGTPYYSSYKFKPLATSAEILGRFEGERRTFLERLFRQMRKAKTWCHLELDEAARILGEPRDRIVRALDYLGEQGLLELQVQGVRHRYTVTTAPADGRLLADELHARTVQREQRELARLQQVIDLVRGNCCQVTALGEHFGETRTAECGHCSWCLAGGKVLELPDRPAHSMDPQALGPLRQVTRQHASVFTDPIVLARFACGLQSPLLTRSRLSSNPLFGVFSHIPFRDVLAYLASSILLPNSAP